MLRARRAPRRPRGVHYGFSTVHSTSFSRFPTASADPQA